MVKDVISIKKNKPNLVNSFNQYLEKVKEDEKNYYDDLITNPEYLLYLAKKYGSIFSCHPTEDDDYDDIGYGKSKKAWKKQRRLLEERNFKGHFKKNKRGGKRMKGKKNRELFDDDDMLYDAHIDDKTIYYYRDFNNPDDVEVFFSLHAFDQFTQEEGIEISEEEVNALMSRDISHCCINPDIKATNGEVQLVTDSSFGGLYWQCCPEEEENYSDYC